MKRDLGVLALAASLAAPATLPAQTTEAAAPAPGPFAAIHTWYLRHIVPLAGRISRDPSAYAYLSRSIFEFGSGPEFEAALDRAGFSLVGHRRFLFGASRLWVARLGPETDQNVAADVPDAVQNAQVAGRSGVNLPIGDRPQDVEWRVWTSVQLLLSVALTVALVRGLSAFINSAPDLPLEPWQRRLAWFLLVGGSLAFAIRSVALLVRLFGPASRG